MKKESKRFDLPVNDAFIDGHFIPFRWQGQYEDSEFNGSLYYNWVRYYDPSIG